ncbi:hypothetical protein B0T16DRAFT_139823 [Cercophora newfieldiana]|uniref:Uncharacterized protein n=1 Tax=Cercophora newfieldiana TaxID=92897 RepID=A0AA39Y487_9PEZI|nr:hypothetical protein B0T16DRAFT_139823 [Cercophora newfieldiana]
MSAGESAVLGLPGGLMKEADVSGSLTSLQHLLKVDPIGTKKLQIRSLVHYILNHATVDVDKRDDQGDPLSFSTLTQGPLSQTRLSTLLAARGADSNACNSTGISLLEGATERGNLGAVKLTLSTGKCEARLETEQSR